MSTPTGQTAINRDLHGLESKHMTPKNNASNQKFQEI